MQKVEELRMEPMLPAPLIVWLHRLHARKRRLLSNFGKSLVVMIEQSRPSISRVLDLSAEDKEMQRNVVVTGTCRRNGDDGDFTVEERNLYSREPISGRNVLKTEQREMICRIGEA